jgi:hypothetical protein
MSEYPSGDSYRVPFGAVERQRLAEEQKNDILVALRDNYPVTPTEAAKAANEIEKLRREAEELRKQLRDTQKNETHDPHWMPPTYRHHPGWRKPDFPQDILKELQSYATEIWADSDAHNLISRAIVEISWLRQRQSWLSQRQYDLPY